MTGYLALILHAHLPFVRHPEHARFLEETWLFEAITETYLPLLEVLEGWQRDRVPGRLMLSLSPTLAAMLRDPLLQERYDRHLRNLLALAEKEIHRTLFDAGLRPLAEGHRQRLLAVRQRYRELNGDLVGALGNQQAHGRLELITCAATHAVLPLLAHHPPSVRAQVFTACEAHRQCFGRDPIGFWLPECGYVDGLEDTLAAANLRWFVVDTHGLLRARPHPVGGVFAPVFTPSGVAAFGRDADSATQVWSREGGYPGDARYRDFYRDAGFDLDLEYVRPHLPAPERRSFTGLKYYCITGPTAHKRVYDPAVARAVAREHARHFVAARRAQVAQLERWLDRPPMLVAPYDAELFGHWWHEGPAFLDDLVRAAAEADAGLELLTPTDYLRRHPTQTVAQPAASSWGEAGHWQVWLNETNHWILPHLAVAQARMTELARRWPRATGRIRRALQQAGRELLLAQASDWAFILRAGTSPDYARQRVQTHLVRFNRLYEQLAARRVEETELRHLEATDNLFPDLDYRHWG